jgi:putative flippase GtrA
VRFDELTYVSIYGPYKQNGVPLTRSSTYLCQNPKMQLLMKRTGSKFILVGITGAAIEIIVFSAMIRFQAGTLISNVVAFHLAFVTCFFLHHHFTYCQPTNRTRDALKAFFQYALLMYWQLVLGTALLWLLIDRLHWVPEISKVIQIAVVTPMSYLVQRVIIFKKRKDV